MDTAKTLQEKMVISVANMFVRNVEYDPINAHERQKRFFPLIFLSWGASREMTKWKVRQVMDMPREAIVIYPIKGENFSVPILMKIGWQMEILSPVYQKEPEANVFLYAGTNTELLTNYV